ncbi:ATP-binding protein [Methanolapillus millepedarum]|uniref:ATP-binding protein n=1 Tax=Methanolapillus millepedarum TaxID=3028296 RepID=A0AA96VFJ9_9EURY|nr:hypothetical protein MsAc7_12390 [Methanosarcinaceae archaeon Ac7]
MKRTAVSELLFWKNKKDRKPLIVRGARQVGKTWLMKSFAESEYENYVYINFENKPYLQLFLQDFNIERILTAIYAETGIRPIPGKTLIILDEIQEDPKALTSLKYFYENAPEYHIVAAGSFLGIALHQGTSFPVGKVDFLDLYPLSFFEFLSALGESEFLKFLQEKEWDLVKTFKSKYIDWLKLYYYIGGMPEVVSKFIENQDFEEVRKIQNHILETYENDFSKHAPPEVVPRIRMVWNAIPAQLARENKKFIYGSLKSGARAKDFEMAIEWLLDCGLIHKINRVEKPGMPLKAYEDFSAFKLFLNDVGLMSAMAGLDIKVIVNSESGFSEFKGALTEQFVLQQLVFAGNFYIYYWSAEKSDGEIDFLVQYKNKIIPIEVKAAENLQAKSLRAFVQKYDQKQAVRTSLSDYREEDWLTNVPLYAIGSLGKIVE